MGSLQHVRVVLVRPQQPDNVGTAARAIANAGLGGLTIVDPPAFDPDRARWMAPHAHDVIDDARIVGSVAAAVEGAAFVAGTTGRLRRFDWPLLAPAQLAASLAGPQGGQPAALLFGPEDHGLSNDDLAWCHAVISIPTAAHRSLNLGQAVTVIAAALRAADPPAVPGAAPCAPADAVQQDRLCNALLGLLERSGYLAGRSREQVHGTLYRLVGRMQPDEKEIAALLGMAHKLEWKLKNPG